MFMVLLVIIIVLSLLIVHACSFFIGCVINVLLRVMRSGFVHFVYYCGHYVRCVSIMLRCRSVIRVIIRIRSLNVFLCVSLFLLLLSFFVSLLLL